MTLPSAPTSTPGILFEGKTGFPFILQIDWLFVVIRHIDSISAIFQCHAFYNT